MAKIFLNNFFCIWARGYIASSLLITVTYREKKRFHGKEGNLIPKTVCVCVLPGLLSPARGARQELSLAGARGVLNNSQVSDTPQNYACLTYEGMSPGSLLMAKRGVFKCHKNLAFLLLIVFYNFARFIKIRFSGGLFFFFSLVECAL